MRVLLYLPVVTPWWFDHIIAPMLRGLYGAAELHVLIAPLWRNTGIEAAQLSALADLDGIGWHVVDADDPAQFREAGAEVEGLLDLVAAIDPDITLARSADFDTPRHFPGLVRYIMEGAAPPYAIDPRWIVLEERPFLFGAMPASPVVPLADCLAALTAAGISADFADDRFAVTRDWRSRLGLPFTRPILCVPLLYEHEENFFDRHAAYPDAIALLSALDAALDPSVMLAVCDHPLNRVHLDRAGLRDFIGRQPERMMLCEEGAPKDGATALLAAVADAMVMDISKSWSLAAFHGTPLVRIGGEAADWINATPLAQANAKGFARATLPAADTDSARAWFAWHLSMRVIDPASLTGALLERHVDGTLTTADMTASLDRLAMAGKIAA